MSSKSYISLLDLQNIVGQSISALPHSYWITAEIGEISVSGAGHCFLELVQHNQAQERLEAKASATIWANSYRALAPYFADAAGSPLAEGMKVMVRAAVQYHAIYGLRLNILDIDPAYTVGEAELQRNRTLARLRAEGIMDMNRELTLPLLPQRIAVVSSEQAAGYRDFVQQLFHNQYGYRFAVTLFAASVQGKNAEQTITEALTQIFERRAEFDAVAVLRGGGSQSDLACFDTYAVASLVAQFPIPVVTGIGHDKDTSVTDSVAHTMLKTPTAAAEFFIEQFAMQERYLEQLRNSVAHVWGQHSERLQARLRQYAMRINVCASKVCSMQAEKITRHLPQRLYAATSQALFYEKNKLQYLEGKLHLLDPHNVLRRGYSLTLLDGKTLRDAQQARQGDTLRTLLSNGEVVSVVT